MFFTFAARRRLFTRRPAERSAPGSRSRRSAGVALSTAVLALAASLGVGGQSIVTSAEAAPLDPIVCGEIYALEVGLGGTTTRRIWKVDTATGALEVNNTVTSANFPSGTYTNGLAIDGVNDAFWFTTNVVGGTSTIVYRVDATTGAVMTFPMTLTGGADVQNIVMGAFDPVSGIYYFGGPARSGLPDRYTVWGFDTTTNTALPGVVAYIDASPTGNGDWAFDGQGRLYISTAGVVRRVDDSLPTSGTTVLANVPVLSVTTITTIANGGGVMGMAFGADGYMYLGNVSTTAGVTDHFVIQVDPSSGEVLSTTDMNPSTNLVGDFASCATPNAIQLRKNLPDGRVADTDQFVLTIDGGGLDSGNTGLTSGNETGVQDQATSEIAGPVLGIPGETYSITEEPSGSTVLTDYEASWECVDTVSSTTVGSGSGATGSLTVPPASADGSNIICTFTNELAPPEATLTVAKSWVVDGQTHADGAQPAGLSAQLQLTGPDAAGATDQDWGVARGGYAIDEVVTMTEASTITGDFAFCEVEASVTEVNGAVLSSELTASGHDVTLTETTNTATVTNTVVCDKSLALVKSAAVVDVDGDGVTGLGDHILYSFDVTNTGDVTMTDIAITDDLLSAQVPPITVTCAPTTIAPTEVAHCTADAPYVVTQADVEATEVVNTATADGTPPTGPPVTSNPDSTITPIEEFRISLQIEKIGEDVDGDWIRMDGSTWEVLEDDNGQPGTSVAVTILDVSTGLFQIDSIQAGTYWLSETSAPDGFSLLAQPVQFTINPDRTVTITANGGDGAVTASDQLITVRDVPALVMPEAGGTGSSPFLIGGILLVLGAAGLALFVRRRGDLPPTPRSRMT